MKTFLLIASIVSSAPLIAGAVVIPPRALSIVANIYELILNPIIILLFSLALLYFMFGIVKMVWGGDSAEVRENGRRAMFWGIIGMFIMFSVFVILAIVASTIGANPNIVLQNV